MAISPYKTFTPGEILTAADLNASFSHITSNGEDVPWPATKAKDFDGFALTLDSDGNSQLQATSNDIVTLTLGGVALFVWNGATASQVNGVTMTSGATGVSPNIAATGGDTNVSLRLTAKGTGDIELGAGGSETEIMLLAQGSATNIDAQIKGKGAGKVRLMNEDSQSVDVSKAAADVVLMQPGGSASDIALRLQGKGASKVQLGDANLAWPDADGSANYVLTTNGAGVLSWVDATSLVIVTTGDIKFTAKTSADSGWVMLDDGTIGDASSGATNRANADTSALFTLLWNNTANAECPVSGGRGASAAADFAAHKTLTLPLTMGRALGVAGAGSGLTSRALGKTTGAETVSHLHAAGTLSGNWTNPNTNYTRSGSSFGNDNSATTVTISGSTASTAPSVMQPSTFLNAMIKL